MGYTIGILLREKQNLEREISRMENSLMHQAAGERGEVYRAIDLATKRAEELKVSIQVFKKFLNEKY